MRNKCKGQDGSGEKAQARDRLGPKGLVCWMKEFRENHVTPLRKLHISIYTQSALTVLEGLWNPRNLTMDPTVMGSG